MRHGNLFVISGPSGAGKGTLVARLLAQLEDGWVSTSLTTRKPRVGEQDGVEYFFVNDDAFDTLINSDGFLEWAQVHDARYGTPRTQVEKMISAGKQVILEIDVQGALQIREKMPEAHLVFIEPPSLEILKERLLKRATDSPEEVEKRMGTAKLELLEKMKYDIRLINDDLDETASRLIDYVNDEAERE